MTRLTVNTQPPGTSGGLAWGLRQEWVTGTEEETGLTFSLTSGAGLASPWLILTVEKDGRSVKEAINVADLCREWVPLLEARLKEDQDDE